MSKIKFDDIEQAILDISEGKPVVVVDDEDRENEGDIIFAAQKATPELVAFTVRYTSGYICVALEEDDCDRLDLPLMYPKYQDTFHTAYTVTVDARKGITTGVSAADRTATIRLLADSQSQASDFVRPGHIVPLRAKKGGVLRRCGHTEAAVDLAKLAGLNPAGVLCEIVSQKNESEMARADELRVFAYEHGLSMISIADLIAWRRKNEELIIREAQVRLPTRYGEFTAVGYTTKYDKAEHIALVYGDISDGENILIRVHSECFTGDILGSLRCDCGPQLDTALRLVVQEGRGIVLYMRGHEGRGIGLISKLKAYELQEAGLDTVDANIALGLPVDIRDFGIGAQILANLGVKSMRLITNNPAKRAGIEGYGLCILERIGLHVGENPENQRYLETKRERMGHYLQIDGLFNAQSPSIATNI